MRRGRLGALLAALVVAALLACALALIARGAGGAGHAEPAAPPFEPRREAEPAPSPGPQPQGAVVEDVAGRVEWRRDGQWVPLEPGAVLEVDDALRTGRASRADVRTGERTRLVVADHTELQVHALDPTLHRFELTRGHVEVRYAEDAGRAVRVERADGSAAAEARGADFKVLATDGALAVASARGEVRLSSAGRDVTVARGEEAVAPAGEAPRAPRPMSRELLLKVAASAARCDLFEGSAEPGSEVRVDEKPVEVGPDGFFRVRMPNAGPQVEVRARDAAGRVTRRLVFCQRKPSDPSISGLQMRWRQ